jgi:hypothetical protein
LVESIEELIGATLGSGQLDDPMKLAIGSLRQRLGGLWTGIKQVSVVRDAVGELLIYCSHVAMVHCVD